MYVKDIPNILDLAYKIRNKDQIFVPMFTGDAGIGKSFSCQQWVKKKQEENPNFGFVDLRIATREAPDLIGLPKIYEVDGQFRTKYALPSIWPTGGEGLLLLEEPNRGKADIMNALMQILTDRKIDEYVLPEKWIIAACINPEDGQYDVNNMDPALRNRFVEYEIEFHKPSFIEYATKNDWDPTLVSWIKSQYVHVPLGEIKAPNKYVSPRTLSQMNAALISGIRDDESMHKITAMSVLGNNMGKALHAYTFDDKPLTVKELNKNYNRSLDILKRQSDQNNYRADLISPFIDDFVKHFESLDIDKAIDVMRILPLDQSSTMVASVMNAISSTNEDIEGKQDQIVKIFQSILKKAPDLREVVRSASARTVDN